MPKLSLVICIHGDRDFLSRLLAHSTGCYDELLVIHDGPDFQDVESLVKSRGGRFYSRPRSFSQEALLPFALENAAHDWIIRFDADEFPSSELRSWLLDFRQSAPPQNVACYRCVVPMWDGRKTLTKRWPNRLFLVDRRRARVIGMPEMGIIPDGSRVTVPLILHHQPARRSHGLSNILREPRAIAYRKLIAQSLLAPPLSLNCWRYTDQGWPGTWSAAARRPLFTGIRHLFELPVRQFASMIRAGEWPRPSGFLHAGIFHFLTCLEVWKLRRAQRQTEEPPVSAQEK